MKIITDNSTMAFSQGNKLANKASCSMKMRVFCFDDWLILISLTGLMQNSCIELCRYSTMLTNRSVG